MQNPRSQDLIADAGRLRASLICLCRHGFIQNNPIQTLSANQGQHSLQESDQNGPEHAVKGNAV